MKARVSSDHLFVSGHVGGGGGGGGGGVHRRLMGKTVVFNIGVGVNSAMAGGVGQ